MASNSTHSNTQTIPVINLQDYYDPAKKSEFIQGVGDALRDIGFFALEGHSVKTEQMTQIYEAIESFFKQPDLEKQKYCHPSLHGQRGFTSFGKEHAKDSDAPDLKEFWQLGPNLDPNEFPGRLQNIWPENLPSFEKKLSDLYSELTEISQTILKSCALYLGLDEGYFASMAHNGETIMRAIHYPPIPNGKNPNSIRAAAHEDINLITLLCESTASGLELLQKNGEWLPVPAIKNQIVIDSGDMIQNITNGYFKSTTHRVINPDNSSERRFSLPFFVHPRPECDLSPLPKCIEKRVERQYIKTSQLKNICMRG